MSAANTTQAVARLPENRYPPPLTRSANVTLCVGGRFSRRVAAWKLRSLAQPLVQVIRHERVVVQVRVCSAYAIDLFHLAR